ncbi:MAG: amidohydrolase [Ignavibacteria bacterium]|nr:amidohydrolase [Ignavibacteria bacterium]
MRLQIKHTAFLFILSIIIVFSGCAEKPDVLYINGKIYTMGKENKVAEAVAVKDGKILETGSTSDLSDKYKPEETIDLKGATVLPGFIDSDGSIFEFSKNLNYINLSFAKSLDEIKQLIIDRTKLASEGEWIGGYGYNESVFSDEDFQKFDKFFLDQIAPNFNVYIVNSTFSAALLNSRALRVLNINAETKSPEGGEIDKDDNGELTGLLFDESVNLVRDNMPGQLKNEIAAQLEKGVQEILKYGITQVHDRSVSKEGIDIIRELIDANKFPLKIYAVLSGEDNTLIDFYMNKGTEIAYKDRLTVRSITVDYDGLIEYQKAVINEDYKNDPKKSFPYLSDNDILSIFNRAADKNFQFSIKAVGDKAVTNSLNIIENVSKQKNLKDARTILSYCEMVDAKDISRFGELKVIPSVRPDLTMTDVQITEQLISADALKKVGLWNSLLKSSGMIVSASDFPEQQINPFVQIYYLTTRQQTDTAGSSGVNTDQKISLMDAVRSYTVWPAYTSFEENIKGTIEAGKVADMIVISNDIFNSDSKELLNTKVIRTIINGSIVYEDKNLLSAGK